MGRAPCCDKANVKRGPWSPEEDAKLKAYIERHGTGGNWIALPHKIGLKRCGKSCRLRWLNYLRPNIKHGGFTEEEDSIICNLYISIGSRWSIIAAQLPGRTDNDIKNYWNTRLKKKLLGRRKDSRRLSSSSSSNRYSDQEQKDGDADNKCSQRHSSTSAMERMQLHMQLQGLNNISPFTYYNNPALWPKHHPLGEKLGLDNQTPLHEIDHSNVITATHDQMQSFPVINTSTTSISLPNESSLRMSPTPPSNEDSNEVHKLNENNFQPAEVVGLQEELKSLIYGKNIMTTKEECLQHARGDHELEYFKEMEDSVKDSTFIWWDNNAFGEKSSTSSWEESASVVDLQPSESIFQDYMLGYDI